jgi:hypothetical protein
MPKESHTPNAPGALSGRLVYLYVGQAIRYIGQTVHQYSWAMTSGDVGDWVVSW